MSVNDSQNFIQALCYGLGTALGFSLVLIVFSSLRERLDSHTLPAALQGTPIAFITAGIMSLSFMGFTGLVSSAP